MLIAPRWLALAQSRDVRAQHRQTYTFGMDGVKAEEPKQSSSGLQFHLHPVSLLLGLTLALCYTLSFAASPFV